jgi:hypothetical protein
MTYINIIIPFGIPDFHSVSLAFRLIKKNLQQERIHDVNQLYFTIL